MYCVIPKKLIRDLNVVPNAKLLYSVINNTSSDGKCMQTNQWFAEIFGVEKSTVSRWINQLKKNDYLQIDIERGINSNNEYYLKRTIYIKM